MESELLTCEFGYGKYLIVPFWYASAAYQARLVSHLAKIRTMARQNSPDMPPKRTKKVRLGIRITCSIWVQIVRVAFAERYLQVWVQTVNATFSVRYLNHLSADCVCVRSIVSKLPVVSELRLCAGFSVGYLQHLRADCVCSIRGKLSASFECRLWIQYYQWGTYSIWVQIVSAAFAESCSQHLSEDCVCAAFLVSFLQHLNADCEYRILSKLPPTMECRLWAWVQHSQKVTCSI